MQLFSHSSSKSHKNDGTEEMNSQQCGEWEQVYPSLHESY